MLSGVNVAGTVALADRVAIPVVASGGIGSIEDLRALHRAAVGTGVEGVVVGRALYDGRVRPEEALALLGT